MTTAAHRILLVDDDPDDRALAVTLLRARRPDLEISEAADGVTFAGHLARGAFDLVVTEHRLAWGDGLRLLTTVKDLHPGLPVVLFTTDPDADLASRAVRAGIDGFLAKTSRGFLELADLVGELLGPAEPAESPASPAEDVVRALSHDLQEPVQLVSRYARLLGERYRDRLGEDGERHLGHLVRSAERVQSMLDDLLEVARAGARSRQRVDLDSVVDEAVETLYGAIEETGARITRDPLPTVEADRSQMVRLFQNLIGNAIKFHGDEPPEVHVGGGGGDGRWELTVRDNGIGISEADRERIFEVFERLHTAEEIPGTGVGLAICRRIAEGHGGTLAVDSQPGGGSIFTLTLPRGETP